MAPEEVHVSHDVRDEGWFVSDPICQLCRAGVPDAALLVECPGFAPPPPVATQPEQMPSYPQLTMDERPSAPVEAYWPHGPRKPFSLGGS